MPDAADRVAPGPDALKVRFLGAEGSGVTSESSPVGTRAADSIDTIADVLAQRALRSVFQPIVDLDTGAVVAHEALVRGPAGPLERPDALFAAAREAGQLAALDAACRRSAFEAAADQALYDPVSVFVNVEPEVLETAPLDDLVEVMHRAAGPLRIVLEITERAIAARPAQLLAAVERVRALGWGIALDDVGAESMSLAFMPLLRPDVIKLDLALVQRRPSSAVAEIMNAVNAHAERTGALVLAEGIETADHLKMARALGAHLGQGWMFGRPVPVPAATAAAVPLVLPVVAPTAAGDTSPFACLPAGAVLRRSPKSLLIALSKQLEREALRIGATCVVAATFQEARHFTPATTARYRDLAERTGLVCALGEGLPAEPLPGVRGADLSPDDPVRGEWDVAVIGPHFAAALLARDLGDDGPDAERMFEYALTYDRETVAAAARSLLARVASADPLAAAAQGLPAAVPAAVVAAAAALDAAASEAVATSSSVGQLVLARALAASPTGISICDVQLPDQPLVYVNRAFEELSGLRLEEVLGRNCRFLQGPDTDAAATARIRAAIASGRECTEVILNHRGPQRTPWWNEVHLAPVRDGEGRVVQYIGTQTDVTARVEAERALRAERDRAASYLTRIEELAATDPLTGLLNRRRAHELVELALWEARAGDSAVALVFFDLDGFKPVNDAFGHAVGDEVLRACAARLRARGRHGDFLARLGGDEFLLALPGLSPATAVRDARAVAAAMVERLSEPVTVTAPWGEAEAVVGASAGVAVSGVDGDDWDALVRAADARMYADKRARTALETS